MTPCGHSVMLEVAQQLLPKRPRTGDDVQCGSGDLQCHELCFPLIGNRHLMMSSAVDDLSVETTVEMGNQKQSKGNRKFTGVSNRELVIGNL